MSDEKQLYGADLVVDSLINHDVDYVFGIPGAKIDRVFDTLEDKGPELIVARHEQNAAFMAQGVGRITGKPGVVLVTSGPGVSNLATGLVTATDEGDPVLAIGGQVKRSDLLKRAHQSMNNVAMLEPITKYAAEVHDANTLSETVANAYRYAKSGKPGASFISIPQDVTDATVSVKAIKPMTDPKLGSASVSDINYLAQAIKNAYKEPDAQYRSEQGKILTILWKQELGCATATDIALATGLANNTLTSMVKKLEEQGLVTIQPCTQDKRKKYISLTDLGWAQKEIGDRVSKELGEIFYQGFSDQEIQEFEAYQERIITNLKAKENDI